MNAEEMKLKCMAIAGEIADLHDPEDYETPEESDMARAANRACLSVVNSIAAIPVEPERNLQEEMMDCYQFGSVPKADPRDAQIATLREALKCLWHETVQSGNSEASGYNWPIARCLTLAALAATEPKRNAPLSQTRDLDPGEGNNITNVERYPG